MSAGVRLAVLWALVAAFAALGWIETLELLRVQPAGIDFLPLWTAGRDLWGHPEQVYDAPLITRQQAWLLPHLAWPRPFVYPPTMLLALAPFGQLPFWPAFWTWNAVGLATLLAAAWRLAQRGRSVVLALSAVAPPVVLALLVGQSVMLAAGLAMLAMSWLEPRPRLAGALFAIAAALKPQALLLAPVALVACGAWEALASAAVVGLALAALASAVFGLPRWIEWLSILPAFQDEIADVPGMMPGVIAPTGLIHSLGLTGTAALALRGVIAVGAVAMVWLAFRRRADTALRTAALLCGGLLVSPYALHYDATVLVPAAAARTTDEAGSLAWLIRLLALLAPCMATRPYIGAPLVLAFAGLVLWQLMQAEQSPSAQRIRPPASRP